MSIPKGPSLQQLMKDFVKVAGSSEVTEVTKAFAKAEIARPLDPAPTLSEYYSAHPVSIMQCTSEFATPHGFEIECSKVHWSAVDSRENEVDLGKEGVGAEAIGEEFERLKKQFPGGFFNDWGNKLEEGAKKGLVMRGLIAEVSKATEVTKDFAKAEIARPLDPAPTSSGYYSARPDSITERTSESATALDFEIECSKAHWSEVDSGKEGVGAETIGEEFERLKTPLPGGFFNDWGNKLEEGAKKGLVMGGKIAEVPEATEVTKDFAKAEIARPLDPAPTSSEYYSARPDSIMQRTSESATALDFEIECSKAHWSEVDSGKEGVGAETIGEEFERLKTPLPGGFFNDWGNKLEEGAKKGLVMGGNIAEVPEATEVTKDFAKAEIALPLDPAPTSSEYYSAHTDSIMQRTSEFATPLDFEIECSKAHWSEVEVDSGKEGVRAETIREEFERLKTQFPGGFFNDWGRKLEKGANKGLVVGGKIAEGGQAEIFQAKMGDVDDLVVKVFKTGHALRDLQFQWPLGMFRKNKSCFGTSNSSSIFGGTLLENGRFAFVMKRADGDLRKLIDHRMQLNNHTGPPFPFLVALKIMLDIAQGVDQLHDSNIVHRDLKASNVLIQGIGLTQNDFPLNFDITSEAKWYVVADYECSVGVVGTGFWRAPEILHALKNHCHKPELFSREADVYSYAMLCYEILTGKIPFDGHRKSDYDIVLSGQIPELPKDLMRDQDQPGKSTAGGIPPANVDQAKDLDRQIRNLLTRCWNHNPTKRPTFKEIVANLKDMIKYYVE